MSFEPSYASKEYEAEMKAKKELKKVKLILPEKKEEKKLVNMWQNKEIKKTKKENKIIIKKELRLAVHFFTTLLTPKKAK